MRRLALTVLLLGALAASAVAARWEYTFETLAKDVPDRVNQVSAQGWEVHDVTFSNLSGYLVVYRRLVPEGTAPSSYAFSLATPANAQAKVDEATRAGWEVYRLVSCGNRLYCLCLRKVERPPAYATETSPGAQLAERAGAASRRGWELQDLGFADVAGYMLLYRRAPEGAPPSTYTFVTCSGSEVEARANEGSRNGWELLRVVPCLTDLYCLAFRKTGRPGATYAVQRAAGRNIESLTDSAVAQGWQLFTVAGDPPGDIDYQDASELLRSALPYLVCFRR